jgi:hypothetical protein
MKEISETRWPPRFIAELSEWLRRARLLTLVYTNNQFGFLRAETMAV